MKLSAPIVRFLCPVLGSLLGLAIASGPATAQALPPPEGASHLTLDRYLDLEDVSEARLSPDGSRLVYVREWIDPMNDRRASALWIVQSDGERNRHLVKGRSPRWSPSGDRLAFLACGTPGGTPAAGEDCGEGSEQQIFVRIMSGEGAGSVTQITRLTESASSIEWAPDGEQIAFNSFVPEEEDWPIDLPSRPDGAEWTPAPRIVDRLDYRQDGSGFVRQGFEHIFVVTSDGGSARQLTRGDYDHGAPRWTPNGSRIVFDAFRREKAAHQWKGGGYIGDPSDVYSVHIKTGEIRALVTRNGPDRSPVVSPHGRRIAFTGFDSTTATYVTEKLYVASSDGGEPREISGSFDRNPERLHWARDGEGIYFTAESEGTENLYYASLEGAVEPITRGRHMLAVTDIGADGTAVGVLSDPHRPSDVVIFSLDDPTPRFLTDVNADLLADVELGNVEEIRYDAHDGLRIQGWIVKPPDFDPSRDYPLILRIHGGPHGMYDVGFSYEYQNYAANGYVVLYTNPRGSSGYGTEFGNAIDHAYPGEDFNDLMLGVDEVISRGYVDENNLFVTGCSGGGVLSSWVVGHTDRFAAAMVRCPVTNWLSFVGTVDDQPAWYHNFEHYPWEDPSEHLRRSPLMYVENVTTPTLLVTGVLDLRTPIAQTEQYYQALKMLEVPTKMIRMNDEWHGTGSNPSNFMRTQLYGMKWFEQYMSGDVKRRFAQGS